MRKEFLISIIIIFFYLISEISSQPLFVKDSLENYIKRGMERWQIPGVAVLIVKDGKIDFAKGFGVREFGKNLKVDENTLFLIGSNTKAFTGTALALLEFEGKWNLEDKITKYLPDFTMREKCLTQELNLIDLVTHRMGYGTFQGDFMYWTSDLNQDQVIEKFRKLKPIYSFRSKYGYTNAGYVVAGKLIEKITGKSWDQFLFEKILNPLHMNQTVLLTKDYFKSQNFAMPHSIVEGKIAVLNEYNIDNLAPAGSIGSSIMDMSHWLIALLDSGKYQGKSVIPFNVIKRTRNPQTILGRRPHPFNRSNYSLYGLGWVLQDYEGKEIIYHTGGVNGFLSSVALVPSEKLGIVILTNNDQNSFYTSLRWEIIDAYLNLPYRNYDEYYFNLYVKERNKRNSLIKAWRDSVEMKISFPVPVEEFVGKYMNETYGIAEIKQNQEILILSLEHHSKLIGQLEYIGNNRFLCTYSDPTYGIKVIPFEIEKGKVKSFELYVDDFIDPFPYKFEKQN